MRRVTENALKRKKQKVFKEVRILSPHEYADLGVDARVEVIQALIPLGLMHVAKELKAEVRRLAGGRYHREAGGKCCVRYGNNPGSVRLAGQRVPIKVPRVRNQHRDCEVPLEILSRFREQGDLNELLLRRVLYGISCRNYEAAAEAFPGAIGLSSSTISRQFIEATATKLRQFQERDLSGLSIVALWIDGKVFAEDCMVIAIGVTIEGRKVPLGFVQAGTENAKVLTAFLRELLDRGLRTDQGLLVIIDGGKGLRAAVNEVFGKQALVQRCQWHKRENVVQYLPKSEQASMRQRLQRAYEKPTYVEARRALMEILEELKQRNLSAAKSLEEGLEETLTLHRLGVFPTLGTTFKTTNGIESVLSLVELRCWKVSFWKNSSQKQRWLATSLLDIEPRLRRVRGYHHLPLLREVIQQELGIKGKTMVA